MSKPSLNLNFRSLLLPILAAPLLAIPSYGDSQARIVRLSDVQGDVQIDRNTGEGYEKAFLNLPITQGVKIQTGKDARAELELEDGSTLRVAPNAVIEVPQLSLRDSGAKVTAIHLQQGTAYVNFLGTKNDEFSLTFVRDKLVLTRSAHLRIELADAEATVAVFKGSVEIEGPSGPVTVGKNQTASFDLAQDTHYELAKNIEESPYDSWDSEQAKYRERYTDNSYSSYSPYSYGTADLRYYGNFFNAPGYGLLWQPYFVGAGWDPFLNGAWAFWPGFGYGWVSSYPWGWTPYHYGSWVYMPMYGWAWQPGGAWMGWNTIPVVVNPPPTFFGPRTPGLPGQRIIPVNQGPTPTQLGKSPNRLQIPNNSAGLGIPRGSVRNLGLLSQDAERRGSVTMRIPSAQPTRAWQGNLDGPSVARPSGWHGGSSARMGSSAGSSAGRAGSTSRSSGGHSSGTRR